MLLPAIGMAGFIFCFQGSASINEPEELRTMSKFRPSNLSNPAVIRSIEPEHLLRLIRPFADYFDNRGLSLPANGQSVNVDFELLSEIIESPDDDAPQDLLDAFGYIDAMATPAGMDKLLPIAIAAGMPFHADLDQTPADVAVQVWLFDAKIVEDQHA